MENAAPSVPTRLKARKQPSQSRSEVTVEAIHEAAIQVLLADGLTRLTTTRVATRAGVSVGTLYQYFPNKEALLFAVLLNHFEEIVEAIENVAAVSRGQPLSSLAEALANAYVDVKTARPDATTALYRVAGAIDQFRLATGVYQRMSQAVVCVLANASDARFVDSERAAFTLLSALAGLSRGTFGGLVSGPEAVARFREEAKLLSCAYLKAAAD